jgi:hypothetical protein
MIDLNINLLYFNTYVFFYNYNSGVNIGNQIRCRAVRGPFDHFEIHANLNLKVLTRISK